MKRENYISWDDYFMSVAILSSMRSKDPSTQVGACIVDPKTNIIVGIGYNGFPIGCSDDDFPWERTGDELETKYPYVVHAEPNAILNSKLASLKDCVMYVTLFPCCECAKLIRQSGIKELIYLDNKYADTNSAKAAEKILIGSLGYESVILREFKSNNTTLTINLIT